jgi:hypothetical protein
MTYATVPQHIILKSCSNLKVLYENLIHCTCLAYGLNRVAETIRSQFPLVNTLVKTGKKMFLESPLRVQMFRERIPDVPLPPEPIVMREGTWLGVACYYAEHFDSLKDIVLEFPEFPSEAIKECQNVLKDKTLEKI